MKSLNKIIVGLIFVSATMSSCAQNQAISEAALPNNAKAFLQQHFPEAKITLAYVEDDKEYDVTLADGTNVEFFKDGNWEKVECFGKAIPESVVPAKISEYVKANYGKLYIEEISIEKNGYNIELNNNLDILFSKDGDFKKIDD